MVKVFSHDPFVGLVIKKETTWGTDPGSWGSNALRVPFTTENLHLDVEEFPASEEFTGLGGNLGVETGRQSVTGSITVEPAYNTPWFWVLFSQLWATENYVADRSIWDATTPVTNLNTHVFGPGSAIDTGLSARVWLGGAGPAASSYFKLITGLVVTRMVWNQPRNGRATVTFDFIGKALTNVLGTGESLPALTTGTKVKAIDFTSVGSRTHGSIMIGATMASFNTMGFTLTIDRKIELTDNYLQTLTTTDKPGIVGTREVTLEIDTDLEQNYGAAGKPFVEFLAQTVTSCAISYDSGVTAVSPEEYNFSFQIPGLFWTDVQPNANQAGPFTMPLIGKAQLALGTQLDSPFNEHALPTTAFDIRALAHQVGTEDLDAKWSAWGATTGLANAT
jgi:hypothetical protein